MEAKAALIRPDRIVELYAKAPVHPDLALVVNLGHPEYHQPVRLDDTFIDLCLYKFRMFFQFIRMIFRKSRSASTIM